MKLEKKPTVSFLLGVLVTLALPPQALQAAVPPISYPSKANSDVPPSLLNPSKPPSKIEWSRFMDLSRQEAEALWNDQSHKGTRLANWDWKWRLGWVKLCASKNPGQPDFCSTVLDEGLDDKALVVRAETASALGQSKDGTLDPVASRKLLAMLEDPRNLRGKTPVMVQKRALYSLLKIGHAEFTRKAATIAERDPDLKAYWSKIAAANAG